MFQQRTEAFKTFLLDKCYPCFPWGIYAEDVFIKVEFQRAGYPHLHCLIWLSMIFDASTEDGKKQIIRFLDDFLTTEIPDKEADPAGYKLVKSFKYAEFLRERFAV